jgi:hypothetical protein
MEKHFKEIYNLLLIASDDRLFDNNTFQTIYSDYIKATDFYEILTEEEKISVTKMFEKYLVNEPDEEINNSSIDTKMVYFCSIYCYKELNDYYFI